MRWPRPGLPLLPRPLRRAWYYDPLPSAVIYRTGLPEGTTLGKLDETVWTSAHRPDLLDLVANHITRLVTERLYRGRDPETSALPLLAATISSTDELDSLELSTRTRRALERSGRIGDSSWFESATPEVLMSILGLGTRSMLELSAVLEAWAHRDGRGSHDGGEAFSNEEGTRSGASTERENESALMANVESILYRFPAAQIPTSDPRFQPLGLSGASLEDGLRQLIEARLDESSSGYLQVELPLLDLAEPTISKAAELLSRAETALLDEQLDEILALVAPPKHLKAIAARLGWDGHGGVTLNEAGRMSGVSRERIRQLEAEVVARMKNVNYLPRLDQAIALLNRAAAAVAGDVSILLIREGLTRRQFLPRGIVAAAKVFGRTVGFEIGDDPRTVLPPGGGHYRYLQALRSLTDVGYVASVAEFPERLAAIAADPLPVESVRRWLDTTGVIVWLDDARDRFWVHRKEGRNIYVNIARKILSVSSKVTTRAVREGILRRQRHRGFSGAAPLCAIERLLSMAGLTVERGYVSSPETLTAAKELGKIEYSFFQALIEADGALDVYDLRDRCLERGVNRNSFYFYLSYSPIIERLAPRVHGLRGVNVDPGRVAALAGRRQTTRALVDHGWTRDGALWLGYNVTDSIRHAGVVQVPAAMRELIGKRQLELLTRDAVPIGTLSISETGSAFGLASYMDRRGVDVGDALVITVDTALGCAVVEAGSSELINVFADGGGCGPARLDEATKPRLSSSSRLPTSSYTATRTNGS